ncbi:N-acetylglucosamine-6-phosphate deacetylase [Paenibacillus apiarius]|uniref:N-acetylglucosamine-6-phosphate deacetylase n=1 Tax=Paenibacillus apiarius TaxID=46240 RepID=A0ABT4DV64_9BACL|nr:N-acetylglucosamine-6-phosphate deacetylase [Paenibacillus apiarius]MBN3526983.1 N-acetylglucosamine-6-phosphate deacetylase [Paenibacillus apiarius]MCY9514879.1 N-acetylglucosamine-6-phosphate deacetylase [Paenibacillus apiarius]MCY9521241.1 N-acetylglucosamine-6-phosphate deacetylase [Paenibacillus apiarius]MCY9553957.1 N-acetylglucosamine-6-phosphate deacetylase [Paenibacillus apiarius]MCY9560331.1 N-acetylglucosamine-6-phosphate deacetylase [Paenibacillus apiarius]
MNNKVLCNVQLLLPDRIVPSATVWIRDGKIERIESTLPSAAGEQYERIDGRGQWLMPGMIDVHIHGANGFDMMDGTETSIQAVSRACAATGSTSFLATSVSSAIEDLLNMIRSVKRVVGQEEGAKIAGIHLEGPYLNPKRKGMQNEQYLRHPDIGEMKEIFREAGSLIKMITIAPELPGGMELISFLKKREVVIAVAHSDATYEEAKLAFTAGASHVTHCFNGMRPIHHRDPGLITAAFEEQHVSLQAIVDQVHLHPAIIRLMHRLKGAEGMVLITDALQAMGMGDGNYIFGGHQVTVSEGVARLEDGTLASSTVTMNEALRLTVDTGISLTDAVQMASTTPANILGLRSKGKIEPGYDADLVLLDEQFRVVWTMIDGQIIG